LSNTSHKVKNLTYLSTLSNEVKDLNSSSHEVKKLTHLSNSSNEVKNH